MCQAQLQMYLQICLFENPHTPINRYALVPESKIRKETQRGAVIWPVTLLIHGIEKKNYKVDLSPNAKAEYWTGP